MEGAPKNEQKDIRPPPKKEHTMVGCKFTAYNSPFVRRRLRPPANCRFDGSVGVYASLAPSCRQCGNFTKGQTLGEINCPQRQAKAAAESQRIREATPQERRINAAKKQNRSTYYLLEEVPE
jgi:hypothetical protein